MNRRLSLVYHMTELMVYIELIILLLLFDITELDLLRGYRALLACPFLTYGFLLIILCSLELYYDINRFDSSIVFNLPPALLSLVLGITIGSGLPVRDPDSAKVIFLCCSIPIIMSPSMVYTWFETSRTLEYINSYTGVSCNKWHVALIVQLSRSYTLILMIFFLFGGCSMCMCLSGLVLASIVYAIKGEYSIRIIHLVLNVALVTISVYAFDIEDSMLVFEYPSLMRSIYVCLGCLSILAAYEFIVFSRPVLGENSNTNTGYTVMQDKDNNIICDSSSRLLV